MTENTKRRALFVLGSIYPEVTGGMEIFNYYFLQYRLNVLQKNDYYWTTNELAGFKQYHIKLFNLWPKSLFTPLQLFWLLLKYGSKIDYIYTGYARQPWVLPFMFATLFRLFKKKYAITIHSGGVPIWKPAFAYRYYFRNATEIAGVSESICESYSELLEGRAIQYIPPLVPFRYSGQSKAELKSKFGFSANDKLLLFVGTLKKMKNPDKVLKAFQLLGKDFISANQLKLLYAGNGEMLNELKSYATENGLRDEVVLTGLVSREQLPDLFKMADYYVISSDYEGTSVSLLEAMYNRLPIIAADSPGINGMLRHYHNALLYPVQDLRKLSACIVNLVCDSQLAGRLAGQSFSDFNDKYSYSRMIERYEEMFDLTSRSRSAN